MSFATGGMGWDAWDGKGWGASSGLCSPCAGKDVLIAHGEKRHELVESILAAFLPDKFRPPMARATLNALNEDTP